MSPLRQTFLVIESAIRGGSLALFKDGREICSRAGNSDISRSEDLLPNINEIFGEAGIATSELDEICISRGPGSFTGLRIGIATAMGLCEALDIPLKGVSLFESMLANVASIGLCIATVPIGRNDVAWQVAERNDRGLSLTREPRSSPAGLLVHDLKAMQATTVVSHSSVVPLLKFEQTDISRVFDLGINMASVIGNAVLYQNLRPSGLDPLYISASTFRQ